MKKTKLIVWIIGLLCVIWFSYWAELRILPEFRSVWKNCIEKFDIYLALNDWEEALASDIILDSNMEFINFENAWIFQSYIPPRSLWSINHFVLLNVWWVNITWWWILWTVYYKVTVEEPYIQFYFKWKGVTSDTNISLEWRDILDNVLWWKYFVDQWMSCEEYTWGYYDEQDFQLAIDNVVDEINVLDWKHSGLYYVVWISCWVFLIILIILLCMLRKRWKRD